MTSSLAGPRQYLFPPSSETLLPPGSATVLALPYWQWVLPTRHVIREVSLSLVTVLTINSSYNIINNFSSRGN